MFSLPMMNDDFEERVIGRSSRSLSDFHDHCGKDSQKYLNIESDALLSLPSINLHQPLRNAGV